ncbi:KpsF/GutQ family sugar-phosphate isomerase [Falsiroseomonas sp. HC035]|uniref:KpsF/GutQ family sugar-phosphate isomerase n=1 Tax=Falsiroseomonas sp. HC035 TaxID=3390999 RepID=UPI003D31CD32
MSTDVENELLLGLGSAQIGANTVAAERAGLDELIEALGGPLGTAFNAAVELIRNGSRRIIVTGMGKSGHIGQKIAATLASTGTTAYFVHPSEASHGDLGMIRTDDVVLALSWSGQTAELSDIISYTRRFSVPLIAITSQAKSTLAIAADVALVLPRAAEACPNGLAPTTSTLMQLAVGDALAVALLSARGFTATDFQRFHPGGKLGSQLKRIEEVMRPLKDVPAVLGDATIGEALIRMSQLGLGYALIIGPKNRLLGIITDGDLRRNMSPDLVVRRVAEIMTRKPKILNPDLLAAEGLAQLNHMGVTAAPVVDASGTALGGVHMIDFVQAGVV